MSQRLPVTGQPVYFTVRATNNGGASTEVTCSLDTYDVTLPAGRLGADFASTSNRHALHGSLVVYDDSPLSVSSLGVGLGQGVYGALVRAWEPVDLQERSAQAYNGGCMGFCVRGWMDGCVYIY